MKALLLVPRRYSIASSLEETLKHKGVECQFLDFNEALNKWDCKINVQIFRLSNNIRQNWDHYFYTKINKWYIAQFKIIKPDLVFVYNNEMLLPETLIWLKKNNIKIAFFLGDNPLFSFTNRYNLTILQYADGVFMPDTFWKDQLKKMGLSTIHHLILPLPEKQYFPISDLDKTEKQKLKTDVLYSGTCYDNSWGYKKALFMNYFTNTNFQLHGNKTWDRWVDFFPKLKNCFIQNDGNIPLVQLNKMFNCTKIIPVDGNPGLLNGIHIRIGEALSSGTLPFMEWNADMDFVFDGINDLPIVKDNREIPELLNYFLNNEEKRIELVKNMQTAYCEKYNIETVCDTIFTSLGI